MPRQAANFVFAGVGALIFGAALHSIFFSGNDLPNGIGWLNSISGGWSPAFWQAQFDRGLIAFNGQWDPQVTLLADAAVLALASALLIRSLIRALTPIAATAVVVAGSLGLGGALRFGEPWALLHPAAITAALAVLHVRLGNAANATRSTRVFGALVGLASVLSSPIGFYSAAAVTVSTFLRGLSDPRNRRSHFVATAVHAVLCVGGGLLMHPLVLRHTATEVSPVLQALALIAAVPCLAIIATAAVTRTERVGPWVGFAAWALLLSFAPTEFLDPALGTALSLVIAFACLLAIPFTRRDHRLAFVGMWTVVAVTTAYHFEPTPVPQDTDFPRAGAVRTFLQSRDPAPLRAAFTFDARALDRAVDLLSEPRVAAALPPIARAPVLGKPIHGTDIFSAEGTPPLSNATAGLSFHSSWSARGGRVGEYQSDFITTSFPLLQTYVVGELQPPETRLILRTASGREIEPLQKPFSSATRWRRINFENPGEPFQIIARTPTADHWLAFTDFVESSRLSWVAGKVASSWTVWFWGGVSGLTLIGGALLLAARNDLASWRASNPIADATRYLPWLAIVGYLAIVGWHLDVYAGGSDSSGYLNSARLLRHGHPLTAIPRPAVPGLEKLGTGAFVPGGFTAVDATRMAPTYPVGLPLIYAAVARVLPFTVAVGALNLAHLLFGAWLIRMLAKQLGLSDAAAWFVAAWLGLCPLYVFMGLQPMSDVPALVWLLAAVVCACRSRNAESGSQWRWALAAGAATALAVMIRPTNLLGALPIVIALGFSARRLIGWMVGGAPGAAFLAWYNHALYGKALTTGYGDPRFLFSTEWIGPTLKHYAIELPLLLSPAIIAAIVAVFLRRVSLWIRLMLASWVVVYLGFYATYSCTHESWWYLRFILPAFPPLLLLAAIALARLADEPRRIAAVVIGVGTAAWLLVAGAQLHVLDSGHGNAGFEKVATWLKQHAPPNALVVSGQNSGALLFYTHVEFVQPSSHEDILTVAAAAQQSHRPLYAALFSYEQESLPQYPGTWEPLAKIDDVTIARWRPTGAKQKSD